MTIKHLQKNKKYEDIRAAALLFSGVTAPEDLKRFSYRPNYTFQGLFELVEKLADYEAGSGK